jgi:hypothetical protein
MEGAVWVLVGLLAAKALDGGFGARQAAPAVVVVGAGAPVSSGGGPVVVRSRVRAPDVAVVYYRSQGLDVRRTSGRLLTRWECRSSPDDAWVNYAWRENSTGQVYRTRNANGGTGCASGELFTASGPQVSQPGSVDCRRCHRASEVRLVSVGSSSAACVRD